MKRTILLLETMLAALVVASGVAFAVENRNWQGWCYGEEGVRCDGLRGQMKPSVPRTRHDLCILIRDTRCILDTLRPPQLQYDRINLT